MIDLAARIAELERLLRQHVERHQAAQAAAEESQRAIHELRGALGLARELEADGKGPPDG